MTDLQQFPDAIEAIFSTGYPTLAYSGAEFIEGERWANWDGSLVVATLKAQHLHLYFIDGAGNVVDGGRWLERGRRLRSARMGPDGFLYVTTDAGSNAGEVFKVAPVLAP